MLTWLWAWIPELELAVGDIGKDAQLHRAAWSTTLAYGLCNSAPCPICEHGNARVCACACAWGKTATREGRRTRSCWSSVRGEQGGWRVALVSHSHTNGAAGEGCSGKELRSLNSEGLPWDWDWDWDCKKKKGRRAMMEARRQRHSGDCAVWRTRDSSGSSAGAVGGCG